MPFIDVKVDYVDTLGAFLKGASDRLETSPRELLGAIGKRILYRFKRNIRDSKTAQGNRFPPLKRKRPKGHNPSMRPLVDSGKLFLGLDWRISGNELVEIGDPSAYGVFQRRGTARIPPRNFISIDPDTDLPPSMFYDFAAYQFSDNLYPEAFLAGNEAITI